MSSSSTNSQQAEQIAAVIRSTPEYTAAFDMELWKAEQMRLHRQAMEKDAATLRQRLEDEFAANDAKRVEELESYRGELEKMAARIKRSGLEVEKRIAALEQRENAFEARRLAIARKHEEHILEVEAKSRRVAEEAHVKTEALRSQLHEKESAVSSALQRLSVVQNDYEVLQRALTRVQNGEGDTKVALHRADAKVEELSRMLTEQRAEMERRHKEFEATEKKNAELCEACNYYKQQVLVVSDKYNKLAEQYNVEQQRRFKEERQRMEQEQRDAALTKAKQGNQQHVWAHEVVAEQYLSMTQKGAGKPPLSNSSGVSTANGGNSDIAMLRKYVEDLAQHAKTAADEAAAAEKAQAKKTEKKKLLAKRRRQRELQQQMAAQEKENVMLGYVPIPSGSQAKDSYGMYVDPEGMLVTHKSDTTLLPGQSPFITIAMNSSTDENRSDDEPDVGGLNKDHPINSSKQIGHRLGNQDPVVRNSTDSALGARSSTFEVSVSSSSDGEDSPNESKNSKRRSKKTGQSNIRATYFGAGDQHLQAHVQPGSIGHDMPVVVPSFAEVDAWELYQQQQIAGSQGATDSFRATPASDRLESPKPHDQHHPDLDAFEGSNSTTSFTTVNGGTGLPPQPAPIRPQPQPSTVAPNINRSEIMEFVERLKVNRQRLLDTGVYAPNDALIVEMGRKISTYASYLDAIEQPAATSGVDGSSVPNVGATNLSPPIRE